MTARAHGWVSPPVIRTVLRRSYMCAMSLRQVTSRTVAAVLACAVVAGNVALANHIEPERAKKYIVELVTTYEPCETPNDYTASLPIPACSPVVRSDSLCGFQPDVGRGKFVGKVRYKGDISIKGVVRELDEGCEGESFSAVVAVRITTEDCVAGDSCTTGDFEMPIGNCIVTDGLCRVRSSVNTLLPGVLRPGDNEGFEMLGCGLIRTSGAGAPVQTLSCGLVIK
jgi:hypothetical protein